MVYIIPLIIAIFGIYYYDYKDNARYKNAFFWGLMFYCVLVSGLSYRMGIDIVNFYETEFYEKYPVISHVDENYLLNFPRRQPGWLLFASICKTIIPDFNFMKTVIAFFVNISIFLTIRRYTDNVFLGVLLYMLFIFPYFSYEILRESMAISMFLFSLKYLENRKWIKYYLMIFMAVLFHESSLFLVVMPLVREIRFSKRQIYILALFAFLLMCFQSYFSFIPKMLASIPFFALKAEGYMDSDYFSKYRTFNISQFYTYVLNVFIPLIGIYYIERFKVNRGIGKFVLVSLFVSIFSAFFPILFRLGNYVSIFLYIYMMYLLSYMSDIIKRNNNLLKVIICSIYILYNFIPAYFVPQDRFAGFPLIVKIYPYTSCIDKETILEREMFYYTFFNYNN